MPRSCYIIPVKRKDSCANFRRVLPRLFQLCNLHFFHFFFFFWNEATCASLHDANRDAWCATMRHPQCSVTRVIWPCSSHSFRAYFLPPCGFTISAKIGGQKRAREKLSKKGGTMIEMTWLERGGIDEGRKNALHGSRFFLSSFWYTFCSSYYRFRFEKIGHEILEKKKEKVWFLLREDKKNRNIYKDTI